MTTVQVQSSEELIDAIHEHSAEDTIVCEGGEAADVPAGTQLDGEGVTVRCNRAVRPLIEPKLPDITIENIRFIGPQYKQVTENGWWDYEVSGEAWKYGAEALSIHHSGVEVRHCEFGGWTHAAVKIGSNNGDANLSPHIWGNAMVDNNCRALGYGTVVQGGDPLIEWNYYNNNRHDIAGGDWEGVSYEARYNHVGPVGRIYGFECHEPGGRRIHIHHNTFEDKIGNHPSKGTGRRKLIRNRGVPTDGGLVENNWFKGEMVTDENGNYEYRNNHEGADEPPSDVGRPRPPDVVPGLKTGRREFPWSDVYNPVRDMHTGLRGLSAALK